MIELEVIDNPEAYLMSKLQRDKALRERTIEPEWNVCESAMHDAGFDSEGIGGGSSSSGQVHPEQAGSSANEDDVNPNISYVFQHYRLLHSQMSANPPVVGTRPLSMDEMDKDSADAAQDAMRFWHRHAKLQIHMDRVTAKTIKYGTGWLKCIYDPDSGDMLDFNEKTDMITMEGDASVYSPSTWDVWLDSKAMRPEDVEHQWERKWGSYEAWATLFHKNWQRQVLKKAMDVRAERMKAEGETDTTGEVPLYFYYEKGMPRNAMKGRFAIITEDGQMITEHLEDNPHYHRKPRNRKEREEYLLNPGAEFPKSFRVGKLPLHMLTDIEVDDRVYGRSFMYYEANGQDVINRLDEVMLNNIKAHGSTKIVVIGGGALETESLNDDQFEVLKVGAAGQVHNLNRPGSMPDMTTMRANLREGGEGAAGINAAMSGKVERETSGSAFQMAVAQGNQVRRPLFNKYTELCEDVYRSLMMIAKEHWADGKIIDVLGKQGAFKQRYIKAADIDGGFEYYSAYGEAFSLDPNMRRQEIMQLIPILQESGLIPAKQIVELLKLNEIEISQDMIEVGKVRQKAIFQEIIKTGKAIAPDAEFEDSEAMLEYARFYLMSEEFFTLNKERQGLIKEHVRQRMQIIAQQAPQMQQVEQGQAPQQLPQ